MSKLKIKNAECINDIVYLTFEDGYYAFLNVEQLQIAPWLEVQWETFIFESTNIAVLSKIGEWIPITSEVLRYLVDANYASEIDKEIERIRLTSEELDELMN